MAQPDEDFRKHLEFLQTVINRMATNSFLIKGWTVTLVVATIAFMAKDGQPTGAVVAVVPVVLFWLLDGYYLQQEKLFRKLYNRVRMSCANRKQTDFCLATKDLGDVKDKYLFVLFTKTIWPYYLTLLIVVVAIVYCGDIIVGR